MNMSPQRHSISRLRSIRDWRSRRPRIWRHQRRAVKRQKKRFLSRAKKVVYAALPGPLRPFAKKFAKQFRPAALRKRTRRRLVDALYRARNPTPNFRSSNAAELNTFVLYRILGNDLYPRHKKGQTIENLTFSLDHEPSLEDCQKRWVVNRIFDRQQEAAVLQLLKDRHQPYLHIPFDHQVYANLGWDRTGFREPGFFLSDAFASLDEDQKARAELQARRLKSLYAINNNGARNAALREGRSFAKWVLPWDGNCFLTPSAWARILQAVNASSYLKYFVVPMARVTDNQTLLVADFAPNPCEEPQIIFRRDAAEEFDETYPYSRRPKVELLLRLGVPGNWDSWEDDPWDPPRPGHGREAGLFGTAGWVARLDSGLTHLEGSGHSGKAVRARARAEAIKASLARLDIEVTCSRLEPTRLLSYAEDKLEALARANISEDLTARRLVNRLCFEADAALGRGPYSVIHKSTLPPSGNINDYWSAAPYWWPNPETADGLPYIKRDGQRVPGTELCEPRSEQYDRTSLQRVFHDATVLALAATVCGNQRYAERGAHLVRRWFLDPDSRMNPHLRYAQVRLGHHRNEGTGSGIIEAKDFYFFLDAIRLLERCNALSAADHTGLAEWLSKYLHWLQESPQGKKEAREKNNHGTLYDLQVVAIAAYLGNAASLVSAFRRAGERLPLQFDAGGQQPFELARPTAQHYCCFNLQSWMNLVRLAERCGMDLWAQSNSGERTLKAGLEWFLTFSDDRPWPYGQEENFDRRRFVPLYFAYVERTMPGHEQRSNHFASTEAFGSSEGIKPFWMLE
jgi:hypothetical protein